jgi:hypothetical protein
MELSYYRDVVERIRKKNTQQDVIHSEAFKTRGRVYASTNVGRMGALWLDLLSNSSGSSLEPPGFESPVTNFD